MGRSPQLQALSNDLLDSISAFIAAEPDKIDLLGSEIFYAFSAWTASLSSKALSASELNDFSPHQFPVLSTYVSSTPNMTTPPLAEEIENFQIWQARQEARELRTRLRRRLALGFSGVVDPFVVIVPSPRSAPWSLLPTEEDQEERVDVSSLLCMKGESLRRNQRTSPEMRLENEGRQGEGAGEQERQDGEEIRYQLAKFSPGSIREGDLLSIGWKRHEAWLKTKSSGPAI